MAEVTQEGEGGELLHFINTNYAVGSESLRSHWKILYTWKLFLKINTVIYVVLGELNLLLKLLC